MAWTKVTLIQDIFEEAEDGTASATWRYYCESSVPVTADAALKASDGTTRVADRGDTYSADHPFCAVRTREVERLSSKQFNVTCGLIDPSFGGAVTPTDLLALPAKVRRGKLLLMEPYMFDATVPNQKVVQNSVGDPWDHMPERQVAIVIFDISKFVDLTGLARIEAAFNTINESTVTIDHSVVGAGQGWLAASAYDPVDGAAGIWQATFQVQWRTSGWKDKIYNTGLRAIIDGELQWIEEKVENQDSRSAGLPHPLNLDGTKMANQTDIPPILEFTPYFSNPWTGVPLS